MKNNHPLRRKTARILAGSIAALLAAQSAQAAALTWDIGAGDAPVVTDGSGTWSNGLGNWTDTVADLNWSNATPDDAIFGTITAGTLGAAGTVTLGSAITAGSLTFNAALGGGTYTIDTATFGLTLNAGITANESATIQNGVGGSVALGANNIWSVAATKTLTVSSTISGLGFGIATSGAGALTLTNTNTYTGQTDVQAGTLNASATDALGTGANLLVSGGTLAISTFNQTVGAVSLTLGSITGSSGTLTGTSFAVESGIISANLAGLGAVLTKTTAGTVTLSGTNTYTGGTNVDGGVLALGSAGALGTTGTISFGGGTLQFSASNTTDYSARFSAAAGQAISLDTNGQPVTLATAMNSVGGTLTKSGGGTLTVSATNGYDGGTFVNGGTLSTSNAAAFGAGAITLANGTTFLPTGGGTPNFTNAFNLTSGTATVAVPFGGGADPTISGLISGGGALTVTSDFSGRRLILPNANTFLGNLTLSGGNVGTRLIIGNVGSLGAGALVVSINSTIGGLENSADLSAGAGVTNNIQITTGSKLNVGFNSTLAMQLSGIISDAGALTKLGTGTVSLSGTNTFSDVTTVSAGTLALANVNALQNSTLDTGTSGAQQVTFTVAGTNTYNLGGLQGTDALAIGGNTISVGANNASTTYNAGISGTGTGGLTKVGSGTLTLANATSTYTGKTTVSAGSLTVTTNGISNAGTAGILGAPTGSDATIDLNNGATFNFIPSAQGNYSTNRGFNLFGTGPGTVTIGAQRNDSHYRFGGVTATGTGPKTLALVTGLNTNGDREAVTFDGAITDVTGDGSALSLQVTFNTQTGSTSFVNLNGGGTFTGPITLIKGSNVTNGTLTIGGILANGLTVPGSTTLGGGSYSGNISLDPTAAANVINIAYASSANQTLSGIISGTGGLVKLGIGTLTTSVANTYTGSTTVSGGGLLRVNGVNTGVSLTAINAGGSLGGTGTLPGAVTLAAAAGASINLVDGSAGTLTLNGATTSLTLGGTAALPNSLYFDLGNAGSNDKIVTAAAHVASTATGVQVYLNQLTSTTGSGAYTLIQGGAASTFTGYTLGTTRSGHNLYSAFGASGNNLVVTANAGTAGAADAFSFWKGNTAIWNTAQWYSDATATTTAVSPGYDSNVRFTTTTTPANLTNTLGTDFEINSLTVADAGLAATSISGNMLTIDATTANSNAAGNGITVNNTAGTTIASKVGLGNSQTWTVGTGATLNVSGVISDFGAARSITKTGAGTLNLSGINTFNGGLTINQGAVNLNTVGTATSSALSGGGAITLDPTLGNVSLMFNVNGSGGRITNPINVTGATGGTVIIGNGSSAGNGGNNFVFSGPITLNGTDLQIQANGGNNAGAVLTVSGGVSGTGNVLINGTAPGDAQSYTISGGSLNNTGTVTANTKRGGGGNQGTGTTISAIIGANVTGLVQSSSTVLPLILSGANTFNGPTSVLLGELRINSIKNVGAGLPNALGQPSLGNATITLGTTGPVTLGTLGTNVVQLTYNGVGDTTDRIINLAGGAHATSVLPNMAAPIFIDNSATAGSLTFTGGITATGASIKWLTLQGSTNFGAVESGAIVENSPTNYTTLIKAGTGTWTLSSGSNSYSGRTWINGGNLVYAASGSVSGAAGRSINAAGGTTAGINYTPGGSIQTDLLSRIVNTSAGAVALGVASSENFDFSSSGNNFTSLSLGATPANSTYTGTLTPNANTYRLGGGGGTLTFNPGGGTFDATQNLVLFGAPVLSGVTLVPLSGTVDFAGASKTFGTISIFGGTTQNGSLTGSAYVANTSAGNATVAASLLVNGGAGLTVSSLTTALGANTLNLTGTNTYTGDTVVNSGTLNLGGGGANGSLDSGTVLKVGNTGSFVYSRTGTNSQTVNGLFANNGASTIANTVSTDTLTLGAITRVGNATVNFGTVTGAIKTTTGNTNSIIGPWTTTGSTTTLRYAIGSPDGSTSTTITGLTGTTATSNTLGNVTSNTTNYEYSAAVAAMSAASALTGNTLRFSGAGATTTIDGTSNITLNGLMNAGSGALLIQGGAAAGGIKIGANNELVITGNGQLTTISTTVIADGAGGPGSVTFSSAGALTGAGSGLNLQAVNTFSGGFTLNSGTVFVGNNQALGTGPINIYGGVFDGNGNFGQTFAAGQAININGNFNTNNNATATWNGAVTLGGTYTIGVTRGSLTLNGVVADGGNVYGITKAGTGTLNLGNNGNALNTYTGKTIIRSGTLTGFISPIGTAGAFGNPLAGDGTIDMYNGTTLQFSPGVATATKGTTDRLINLADNGPGTVIVTPGVNNNGSTPTIGGFTATGTGAKTLTMLNTGNLGAMYVTGSIPDSSDGSPTTVTVPFASNNANEFHIAGVSTFTGPLTIGQNAAGIGGKFFIDGSGQLGSGSYANNIALNGLASGANTATFIYNSSANQTLSGVISGAFGALTKQAVGTLTLSGTNTYAGVTTLTGGVLSVGTIGNGGVAGNLGAATNAAANLVLNGGTLQYTGATASSDRNFTINNATTGTIDVTVGANTLTISGASTATSGALTKIGAGTLALSGANLYTGTTTVSAGALQSGITNAIKSGNAVTVSATAAGTATLDLAGFDQTIGGLGLKLGGGTATSAAVVTNSTGTSTLTLSGGAAAATYLAINDPLGATISVATVNLANAAQTFTVGDSGSVSGSGNELTVSSAITAVGGSSALVKAGAGALRLDGAQGYDILTANGGTTNVNGVLGTAPGLALVSVTGGTTKLKFGSVSQTLSSLTIGAGSTVIFTSGTASGSLTGGSGGGKAPGFGGGSAVVPEPGTLGLLLVGALGLLNRRRRQA